MYIPQLLDPRSILRVEQLQAWPFTSSFFCCCLSCRHRCSVSRILALVLPHIHLMCTTPTRHNCWLLVMLLLMPAVLPASRCLMATWLLLLLLVRPDERLLPI
jgi:hypothetical protein